MYPNIEDEDILSNEDEYFEDSWGDNMLINENIFRRYQRNDDE